MGNLLACACYYTWIGPLIHLQNKKKMGAATSLGLCWAGAYDMTYYDVTSGLGVSAM